ncbi:unnamed protein product, partial [Effrenium voratum]
DCAFKIGPLKVSKNLIRQLTSLDVSLKKQATSLQALIRAGKSKNKHYNDVVKEVEKTFEVSKEKIELAKALIRAAEKAQDKELKKEPKA